MCLCVCVCVCVCVSVHACLCLCVCLYVCMCLWVWGFSLNAPTFHAGLSNDESLVSRLATISISPSPKLISLEEARTRAQSASSRSPRPRTKSVDLSAAGSRSSSGQESPLYCNSIELPVRSWRGSDSSSSGSGSLSGKRWRSFFTRGRSFEAGQSVANIQETNQGTYVSVTRESHPRESHPRDQNCRSSGGSFAEEIIQARSVEELHTKVPSEEERRTPDRHIVLEHVKETKPETSVQQPVTICLSQPVSLRPSTRVKKHPVLTSFKRVTSEQTVFYTTVEYHPAQSTAKQRRASTGADRKDSITFRKQSSNTEYRPVSVYDNWPASVHDRDPVKCRYSSPVSCPRFNAPLKAQSHRYSSPVDIRYSPPVTRNSKSHRQRISDEKFAITGARLAHASLIPCTDGQGQ